MAIPVIVDQETGEEALLIDPEGQYIAKSNSLDPDFRLFSQTRFSTRGLKLNQNDDDSDVLRCKYTGATVHLTTDRGILVYWLSRRAERMEKIYLSTCRSSRLSRTSCMAGGLL